MDTIPTPNNPVSKYYLDPLWNYIYRWRHNSQFLFDFIWSFPFRGGLTYAFICLLDNDLYTVTDCWRIILTYISFYYTPSEIADCFYEALSDVQLGSDYLRFLIYSDNEHMWPIGQHFMNPLMTTPNRNNYLVYKNDIPICIRGCTPIP